MAEEDAGGQDERPVESHKSEQRHADLNFIFKGEDYILTKKQPHPVNLKYQKQAPSVY